MRSSGSDLMKPLLLCQGFVFLPLMLIGYDDDDSLVYTCVTYLYVVDDVNDCFVDDCSIC